MSYENDNHGHQSKECDDQEWTIGHKEGQDKAVSCKIGISTTVPSNNLDPTPETGQSIHIGNAAHHGTRGMYSMSSSYVMLPSFHMQCLQKIK